MISLKIGKCNFNMPSGILLYLITFSIYIFLCMKPNFIIKYIFFYNFYLGNLNCPSSEPSLPNADRTRPFTSNI